MFRNQDRNNAQPMIFGLLVGLNGVCATAIAVAGQDDFTLLLDENAIDNGSPPNFFDDKDVNDDIADKGQRTLLRFFADPDTSGRRSNLVRNNMARPGLARTIAGVAPNVSRSHSQNLTIACGDRCAMVGTR